MDIVVKLSKNYIDFTAQFIDPSGLIFSKQLVGSSTETSFVLNIDDNQIGEALEYRKVAIYAINPPNDQLIWSGYISDIQNDSKIATVICKEEKDYLAQKIIFVDKDYTSTSIPDMLTELINESNARDGGFNGNLTFETNLTANAGKEFKAGTTYADILDQAALLNGAEWTKSFNKIIFKTTIGADKTSGPSQVLLTSTRQNPNENNISNFLITRKGKSIITNLLGADSSSKSSKTGDTSIFGFIEASKRFDDGSLDAQTQELVDKSSVSQREVTLDANSEFLDFRDISVGDVVQVKIDYDSPLTQIDQPMTIIETTVAMVNKKPELAIKVAEETKPIADFVNFIKNLRGDLDRLELQ